MIEDNFYISKSKLLELLKTTFDVSIDRFDSEKEIYLKIGQKEVIEFIEQINQEEAEN